MRNETQSKPKLKSRKLDVDEPSSQPSDSEAVEDLYKEMHEFEEKLKGGSMQSHEFQYPNDKNTRHFP